MDHIKKAEQLFLEGYNCSQSVVGAFADMLEIDEKQLLRLSASFGGGMGRMREVCGAVTGMFMVAGLIFGYDDAKDGTKKAEHYELIRKLADEFKKENGSIICRELLADAEIGGKPEPRTEKYYKKRPCVEYVKAAASILEQALKNN